MSQTSLHKVCAFLKRNLTSLFDVEFLSLLLCYMPVVTCQTSFAYCKVVGDWHKRHTVAAVSLLFQYQQATLRYGCSEAEFETCTPRGVQILRELSSKSGFGLNIDIPRQIPNNTSILSLSVHKRQIY